MHFEPYPLRLAVRRNGSSPVQRSRIDAQLDSSTPLPDGVRPRPAIRSETRIQKEEAPPMPNHSLPRLGALSALLLVAMLLVASPVFAKTITVDGNPAEWILVERIGIDPDEATANAYDITQVFFTNNTEALFFRVDTVANNNWSSGFLRFCFNIDDDTSTGTNSATSCGGQQGVDYRVDFSYTGTNGVLVATARRCQSGSCGAQGNSTIVPVGSSQGAFLGTGGGNSSSNVTELSIALTTFGADAPSGCTSALPCDLPTTIYFNEGASSSGDTISLLATVLPGPTPVTLTAFSATRGENGVNLAWSTASELNIQGFHILRSAGGREAATRITPELIPGEGSGVSGGTYRFTDTDAAVGSSYSYWLEVINSDGTPEEYGPARYSPATAAPTLVYLPLVRQ
jgi:hypothetical protein